MDRASVALGPKRPDSAGLTPPCSIAIPDVHAWRGKIVGSQSALRDLSVIGLMRDPRPDESQKGFLEAFNLVAISDGQPCKSREIASPTLKPLKVALNPERCGEQHIMPMSTATVGGK